MTLARLFYAEKMTSIVPIYCSNLLVGGIGARQLMKYQVRPQQRQARAIKQASDQDIARCRLSVLCSVLRDQ
jgi:hypothetical protein